jgi:hypothetical protein
MGPNPAATQILSGDLGNGVIRDAIFPQRLEPIDFEGLESQRRSAAPPKIGFQ